MNPALYWSLLHQEQGYALFPIAADSKIPVVKWTVDYTMDREQVTDWWTKYPDDNIGINCKESSLLVIDLDGIEGIENFEELWAKHESGEYQKYTRWSHTPHGRHIWFDLPSEPLLRNSAGVLAAKVDTRGSGGMIVAPGSVIDGCQYRLINDMEPVSCPAWLEDLLRQAEPPAVPRVADEEWPAPYAKLMLKEVPKRVAAANPGRRNDVLNREAWRLRAAVPKLSLETVQAALMDAVSQNDLPEDEARRTIRSGLGAGNAGC